MRAALNLQALCILSQSSSNHAPPSHSLLPWTYVCQRHGLGSLHYLMCIAVSRQHYCHNLIVRRAWQDIKAFMDTDLPGLLQESSRADLPSSQAQSSPGSNTTDTCTQTGPALNTTAKLPEGRCPEHIAAVKALLPVVKCMPKDSLLQLLAVRSGSPAGCCTSAQAACTSSVATEAAQEAAYTSSATAEEAAQLSPVATTEAACTSLLATEAACISPAATHLFLSELHSTELFQVVRHCLSQVQQSAARPPVSCWQTNNSSIQKAQPVGQVLHHQHDRLSGAAVSTETIPAADCSVTAAHPASADAHNDTTSLAVASAEVRKASDDGHALDMNHGLRHPAFHMADDTCAKPMRQQEVDDVHSNSCRVQQQLSDTAVQTGRPSHRTPSVSGPSLGLNPDCSVSCMVAATAEQDAVDAPAPRVEEDISPPLAEMMCMLLLLVPKTAWYHAGGEVRTMHCQYASPGPLYMYTVVHCHGLLTSH